jgi:hypothetical protein
MTRLPRRRVHPEFRKAIRARGVIHCTTLLGLDCYTKLNRLFNHPYFGASALNLGRLERLAPLIGYTGPILVKR